MKSSYIHKSKFGYFYSYCLLNNPKKIKREISKIKELVDLTNNLQANNNTIYNKKIMRKQLRFENVLLRVAKKAPEYLINFLNEYKEELNDLTNESDPNIIARHISQSYLDAYYLKKTKNNLLNNNYKSQEKDIVITLTEEERENIKSKKNKVFSFFLNELKKNNCQIFNRQIMSLDKIFQLDFNQYKDDEDVYQIKLKKALDYGCHNLDMIFKKGKDYPTRTEFIKVISIIAYANNLKERTLSDINEYLKKSLEKELIMKDSSDVSKSKKTSHFGYEIPINLTEDNIDSVNEELYKEKEKLIEAFQKNQLIQYEKTFNNSLQTKKTEMINSYFDSRLVFKLDSKADKKDFVDIIINLCELADELIDDIFKKVLFDAHDSSNLLHITQKDIKNIVIRNLYELYSPYDKLSKYEQAKLRFEEIFRTLEMVKRDDIYKLVYEQKQQKHLSVLELITSKDTILSNLSIREEKFIESHAVEEFKYKALNKKYLNYDLEVVARDIDINDLPPFYQKLKRTIIYTNFADEIRPGDNREQKYREAINLQQKTLTEAEEMVAKVIMSKNGVSYQNEDYERAITNIYENILHVEKVDYFNDDYNYGHERLEKAFQMKKKAWDEQSTFVKALYLVVSRREENR